MFDKIDVNRDGVVDFDEFSQVSHLSSHKHRNDGSIISCQLVRFEQVTLLTRQVGVKVRVPTHRRCGLGEM